MLVVTLRMHTRASKRDEFFKTTRAMLEAAREEKGCLSYRLYKDVEEDNVFTLVEEWQSQEALIHHLRSSNYRRLFSLLVLLSEPPEIKFNTVAQTEGLEYVEKVLNGLPGAKA